MCVFRLRSGRVARQLGTICHALRSQSDPAAFNAHISPSKFLQRLRSWRGGQGDATPTSHRLTGARRVTGYVSGYTLRGLPEFNRRRGRENRDRGL
jgi:hypothetical protein